MTSIDKKIQQEGYNRGTYAGVRHKINNFDIEAEIGKQVPKGNWKKNYQCRKNKGNHTFHLIKPTWINSFNKLKHLSIEEYYQYEEKEKKERTGFFSHIYYHYECTACGKLKWSPKRI